MTSDIARGAVFLCGGFFLYAYVAYPLILRILVAVRGQYELPSGDPPEWPRVSISLPAHNEEAVIADTLERLLAIDYPSDRLQIVVVSDASTDRTEEIVESFADRGVELVRLAERRGKTGAENAAVPYLGGEIVVSTDATTRILPGSIKRLAAAFQDPSVGVASGRDRSVSLLETDPLHGESRYVGYEMWIRDLETRLGTIVGASGCCYAARRELHQELVPEELSRDFIAALNAREAGYRAVSVPDAVALVPRARSLKSEYRRKVRTMARGLDSLWNHRRLLDPFRYGLFSWQLASHKLCRWLVPLTLPFAVLGILWLGISEGGVLPMTGLAACAVFSSLAAAAYFWPLGERELPSPLAYAGYVGGGLAAGFVAWVKALTRERKPIWTPTRRQVS